MTNLSEKPMNRRRFVINTAKTAAVFTLAPLVTKAATIMHTSETYTVGQIIDKFIAQVPGGVVANTVDTLKSGNRDIKVTGVVTTMFATIEVIKKAIDLNANFIIAHEPTFYNHQDDTSWLQNDEVYRYKEQLLKQHNIAVWRCHDYIHRMVPDGVTIATLQQLGWDGYADKKTLNILNMPATPLNSLIKTLKEKLQIERLRYIGNTEEVCSKVLFMPGAAGGQRQIQAIAQVKPDVMICGEVAEWETAEYVRDARARGNKIALVVLGHIASEEAGSQYMVDWMRKNIPSIKATHIRPGNSLSFM